jgi:hypothetical protein
MNEIEEKFLDAYFEVNGYDDYPEYLTAGEVIGPYKVDFCVKNSFSKFVIEIDGHDAHKTKEQRDYDYKRERYLQKLGYFIIRFTGTEVFLNPIKCASEASTIINAWDSKQIDLNYAVHLCIENNLLDKKWLRYIHWNDVVEPVDD